MTAIVTAHITVTGLGCPGHAGEEEPRWLLDKKKRKEKKEARLLGCTGKWLQ